MKSISASRWCDIFNSQWIVVPITWSVIRWLIHELFVVNLDHYLSPWCRGPLVPLDIVTWVIRVTTRTFMVTPGFVIIFLVLLHMGPLWNYTRTFELLLDTTRSSMVSSTVLLSTIRISMIPLDTTRASMWYYYMSLPWYH